MTLGLERHTSRNLHRLPVAIMRLRRMRRRSAEFFRTYDAVLTPTLADETPRIGYLAPTDYQQVMDRLIDWVAFTPLQNVTGEPAISLPLAQSADGMPVGMMLSPPTWARKRCCWNWPTNSKRRGRGRGSKPAVTLAESVGSELVEHSFEFALLGRGQLGQDAGIGVADRGLRALQQRAALTGQRGR